MALYETVFIARPDMAAEDVDNLTAKLEKIITDGKGKVVSKEYWGLRKMAYKINKGDRGHYVMLSIDADYSAIAELNRIIGFNEDIIRNVTLNKDANYKGNSELFLCENAKDFKAGKTAPKDVDGKYDSIADQMQFDN